MSSAVVSPRTTGEAQRHQQAALDMSQFGNGSSSRDEGAGSGSGSDSMRNYQFTFSRTGSTSGNNSIIEPDPNAVTIEPKESSQSLTESVRDYPEEFGRTYHAYRAGSYVYPNDLIERERLGLQSEIMTMLFGGRLFFSPLDRNNPPGKILDIATGTGEWAIQMGDAFPRSEVIATDLSPIQPFDVPPNVSFYVEDSGEPWDYSHNFDFIHTRVTTGSWSNFKTQIAEQAFKNINPGGWFESQEVDCAIGCDDGTLPINGPLDRWFHEMQLAGIAVDRPVIMASLVKQWYLEVGFVDVQERMYKIPTNGWPKDERLKEMGKMWERQWQTGLSGFSFWLFNRAFGRTSEHTEIALVDVRRELSDTGIHAFIPIHVVWGRKPFPGEVTTETTTEETAEMTSEVMDEG